jgi:cytochrome c551/c552
MIRSSVVAVLLGITIALAGCAGRSVDEDLLPTRVPTLDPHSLALAAETALAELEPTATDTPLPPTAVPEPTATDTPLPPTAEPEPTTEAEADDTETLEPSSADLETEGITGTEDITATTVVTVEEDINIESDGQTVEDETVIETATITATEPITTTLPDIDVQDAITATESLTETATPQPTEDSAAEPTPTQTAIPLPTATASPQPAEPPADEADGAAEEVDPVLAGLPDSLLAAMAEADPDRGETLSLSAGCIGCHALDPNQFMAGPTWHNMAEIAATRVEGESAGLYLYRSIMEPNAYIVEGYQPNIMLQIYDDTLAEQDLADIIAYLLTLRSR